METTAEIEIGGEIPGYYGTAAPFVRLPSWGPIAERLDPYAGDEAEGLYFTDAETRTWRAYPNWSSPPQWKITDRRWTLYVRVEITGRTITRWNGERWLRGRIEFCHDGSPSEFAPCFVLVK